eukprot:m.95869 g.95869  ORF g.95869 m.95869 type:complete len:852 (+) comp15034_c0_seq3:74-2629(+)
MGNAAKAAIILTILLGKTTANELIDQQAFAHCAPAHGGASFRTVSKDETYKKSQQDLRVEVKKSGRITLRLPTVLNATFHLRLTALNADVTIENLQSASNVYVRFGELCWGCSAHFPSLTSVKNSLVLASWFGRSDNTTFDKLQQANTIAICASSLSFYNNPYDFPVLEDVSALRVFSTGITQLSVRVGEVKPVHGLGQLQLGVTEHGYADVEINAKCARLGGLETAVLAPTTRLSFNNMTAIETWVNHINCSSGAQCPDFRLQCDSSLFSLSNEYPLALTEACNTLAVSPPPLEDGGDRVDDGDAYARAPPSITSTAPLELQLRVGVSTTGGASSPMSTVPSNSGTTPPSTRTKQLQPHTVVIVVATSIGVAAAFIVTSFQMLKRSRKAASTKRDLEMEVEPLATKPHLVLRSEVTQPVDDWLQECRQAIVDGDVTKLQQRVATAPLLQTPLEGQHLASGSPPLMPVHTTETRTVQSSSHHGTNPGVNASFDLVAPYYQPNPIYDLASPFRDYPSREQSQRANSLNSLASSGTSLLIWAVSMQRPRCVRVLLDAGCDPRQRGQAGRTALHVACMLPDTTISTFLVQHGADINAQDDELRTPLMYAGWVNNPDQARYLLSLSSVHVNVTDSEGWTPLHHAALHCGYHVLALLVADSRVDYDVQDSRGRTALLWTVTLGQTVCVQVLLQAGADIALTDDYENSCLHLAIRENLPEVLQLLLEHCIVRGTLRLHLDQVNVSNQRPDEYGPPEVCPEVNRVLMSLAGRVVTGFQRQSQRQDSDDSEPSETGVRFTKTKEWRRQYMREYRAKRGAKSVLEDSVASMEGQRQDMAIALAAIRADVEVLRKMLDEEP